MREMGGTGEKGRFEVRSSKNLEPSPVSCGYMRCVGRVSGGFVQAWNAGAYPAEDFIGDRADPVGHFISPD